MTSSHTPTVVLVHGAFADASGYAGVIRELTADGYTVVAPPNPLRGLASDAAALHAVVSAIEGPVLLVGHSYGGAVIAQASATLSNVTGLVFLAGWALDAGDSLNSIGAQFPPVLVAKTGRATSYEAPGAAGGPDLFIDPAAFRETFCADSTVDVAAVMAATQRPLSAAAAGEKCTAAGWHNLPTWYLVSAHDQAINPDAERFMAQRMGATTAEINGSHTAFVANPVAAANFIKQALTA
jgi:pimeloyl-ACP methyl ester carboxylesterase